MDLTNSIQAREFLEQQDYCHLPKKDSAVDDVVTLLALVSNTQLITFSLQADTAACSTYQVMTAIIVTKITIVVTVGVTTSCKNTETKKATTERTNPRNKDYGRNDDNKSTIIITAPLACLSDTE